MKIQLDTILTLLILIASGILTQNPFIAIVLALGFAKGWDIMKERREKKEETKISE